MEIVARPATNDHVIRGKIDFGTDPSLGQVH